MKPQTRMPKDIFKLTPARRYEGRPLVVSFVKFASLLLFVFGTIYAVYLIDKKLELDNINGADERVFLDQYSGTDLSGAPQDKLAAISSKALSLTPPNLQLSKKSSELAVNLPKPCLKCDLNLVYIDILENQLLTEMGLKHLTRSYEVSPYGDREIMLWRLAVSDAYWKMLPQNLQELALTQITALAQSPEGRKQLRALNPTSEPIVSRIN